MTVKTKAWILASVVVVVGVAVATLVLVPWLRGRTGPARVQVASVQPEIITDMIVAAGETVPVEEVQISTDLYARIVTVNVDVGQAVHPGDILAQLEPTTFQNSLSKAMVEEDNARKSVEDATDVLARQEELEARGVVSEDDVRQYRQFLTSAIGQLELAKINVAMYRNQLANTTIRSPISGVVSGRMANQGEMTGRMLFAIESHNVSFTAVIDEEKTGRLREGLPGEVTLAAFPGRTFSGQILKMNPAVITGQRTRGFSIWLSMPDLDSLVTGLTGYVRIRIDRPALVVPSSALVYFSGDQALVFVVEGPLVRTRPVVFGAASEGKMEIVSGLEPGEMVVTGGQQRLKDGSKVTLEP